jgi:opacity protein-like surface antigen
MSQGLRVCLLALGVFGFAMPVAAQNDNGVRVSGFVAGVFGEGETNIGTGGSAGYRFTPRFGLDFEVLALPDFDTDDSRGSGRGVAFLTQVVSEFPGSATWLVPYVQGGGGVANIRQTFNVVFVSPRQGFGRRGPLFDLDDIRTERRGIGETSLVLTVGGGVDFGLSDGLAVGPTISYLKLFGSLRDHDLTRIGGRVTYRF